MLLTVGALGTILALVLGYIIAQMIARPLATANALVGAIAEGDLSQKADVTARDEVGQMLTSMNGMVDNLNAAAGVATRFPRATSASSRRRSRPRTRSGTRSSGWWAT